MLFRSRENIKKKPAPDTVNEALRQLHANRDRAVYIGDSDVDIKAHLQIVTPYPAHILYNNCANAHVR